MTDDDVIRVAAVVLKDDAGRVLTVRKRGTRRFQFPGGKPEPGETYAQAAVRECREEVGVRLDSDQLELLGVFTAAAANEEGRDCQETLFAHPSISLAEPGAEIEEARWLDPSGPLPEDLAPLLRLILPMLATRRGIGQVTFFAGSATGVDPSCATAVRELGVAMAAAGLTVVYGGGKLGLMGALADAALAAGGQVTGVIPQALVDGEIAHAGLTRLEIVDGMAERKARMAALGGAFVALPGGTGTLEEFFEAWTWQQLGVHSKPVALYNVAGFWDPVLAAVASMVEAGFLRQTFVDALIVVSTPSELVEALTSWSPPPPKWSAAPV